ncbi:Na(+)-translocating NADH-quinone reductase subunit B [Vibrio parahaemolyticus]|nr:Na(+)-translocating NADH-quinone reductase subunit B [Vibrio parahaemolyticus]
MELEVEYLRSGAFIAYRVDKTHREIIRDNTGGPLRFSSIERVRAYFSGAPYAKATLIHYSSYDVVDNKHLLNRNLFHSPLAWFDA